MSVPSDKLKLMIQSYSTPKKKHPHIFSTPNNVSKNKQSVQFKDNRPDATTQLKVQQIANQPIQRQANKTGMPDNLKSGIENLSGMDMSDVKVHYNSSQPAQLQAHAFAQGNQIHIASGQEKHLPHEAWHVVQQKQSRVTPTKQLKGKVNINDDSGLEKEADVMGAKALQLNTSQAKLVKERSISLSSSTTQLEAYTSKSPDKNVESPATAIKNKFQINNLGDIDLPFTQASPIDRAREIEGNITYKTLRKTGRKNNATELGKITGLAKDEVKLLQGVELSGYYHGGHLLADFLVEGDGTDSFIPANLAPQAGDFNAPTYFNLMENKIAGAVNYPNINIHVKTQVQVSYPGDTYNVSLSNLLAYNILSGKALSLSSPHLITIDNSKSPVAFNTTDQVTIPHRIPNRWNIKATLYKNGETTPLSLETDTNTLLDSGNLTFSNKANIKLKQMKSTKVIDSIIVTGKNYKLAHSHFIDPSFNMTTDSTNNSILINQDQEVIFVGNGVDETTAKRNYVSSAGANTSQFGFAEIDDKTDKGSAGANFNTNLDSEPNIAEGFNFTLKGGNIPATSVESIKITVQNNLLTGIPSIALSPKVISQLTSLPNGSHDFTLLTTSNKSKNLYICLAHTSHEKAVEEYLNNTSETATKSGFSEKLKLSGDHRMRVMHAKQWTPSTSSIRTEDIISWLQSAFSRIKSSEHVFAALAQKLNLSKIEEQYKVPFELFAKYLSMQDQLIIALRDAPAIPQHLTKYNSSLNKLVIRQLSAIIENFNEVINLNSLAEVKQENIDELALKGSNIITKIQIAIQESESKGIAKIIHAISVEKQAKQAAYNLYQKYFVEGTLKNRELIDFGVVNPDTMRETEIKLHRLLDPSIILTDRASQSKDKLEEIDIFWDNTADSLEELWKDHIDVIRIGEPGGVEDVTKEQLIPIVHANGSITYKRKKHFDYGPYKVKIIADQIADQIEPYVFDIDKFLDELKKINYDYQ